MVEKILNIGIIGLGKMGMLHLMNSCRFDNVKIVAAADMSKSRLRKAERLGVKDLYSDFHDLLNANGDLDAVIISLPNFLHLESVKLTLESGINVFIEKPLARTTEECKEILHSVRKSGRKLMVGHCLRFLDVVDRMKTIVEKGHIGNLEIMTLESIASGPFSHGVIPKPIPEWWFDSEKVGGGALLDIGYHLIDLFRYFAGDCHLLFAHLGHKYNLPLEDSAIVVIQSRDSLVKGIVHVGWYEQVIFPHNDFRVILHGDYGYLSSEKFAPNNIYTYAIKEGIKNLFRKVAGRKIKPLAYAYYLEGFNRELTHFFNCIENDLEPSVSAIDGLKTVEVIEEAYRQASNSAKSD